MASSGRGNNDVNDQSIVIGISVSNKALTSSISASALNSAVTEVAYDEYMNKVRAKQYLKVRGKIYLIGIECDCSKR